ncbi:hypothetical protein BGZ63DRAFT_73638 [Mariannaea sp. PMI_226]|nr:hypothetical protein BGZ63DRAFT_73638 [Mariannaea sp. PMI_226]
MRVCWRSFVCWLVGPSRSLARLLACHPCLLAGCQRTPKRPTTKPCKAQSEDQPARASSSSEVALSWVFHTYVLLAPIQVAGFTQRFRHMYEFHTMHSHLALSVFLMFSGKWEGKA